MCAGRGREEGQGCVSVIVYVRVCGGRNVENKSKKHIIQQQHSTFHPYLPHKTILMDHFVYSDK